MSEDRYGDEGRSQEEDLQKGPKEEDISVGLVVQPQASDWLHPEHTRVVRRQWEVIQLVQGTPILLKTPEVKYSQSMTV